jgi:SAM-dependent methyltransferase
MDSKAVCPICGGESTHEMPVAEWGEMRRCISCELIFADPMTLPEAPESLYNKAYQGVYDNPGMKEYSERFEKKQAMKKESLDPEDLLFWGAYEQAKNWLEKNAAAGSVILDIGCGLGGWLPTLRKKGFSPVGLDVAEEVVKIRTEEGFEVYHGTIDSIEPNWKNPSVCTCFFVLQHIQDPVDFLATIRAKFPNSTLIIGIWNKFPAPDVISSTSLPPRTLSWWGPKSLRKALEKAGYQVGMPSQSTAAGEFPAPRILRRIISRERNPKLYFRLIAIYYAVKPVVFFPLKLWKHLGHKTRTSTVLAIAKPS